MNSKPIRLYAVLAIAGCFVLSIVVPARRILAQSGTWAMKAPMPIPASGQAVGVVNGVLYSVGGGSCGDPVGSPRAPTLAYDPTTDTWTTKTRMPTPRKNMAGAALNGLIYAIGGDNDFSNFATVEAYDPTTDTWTAKAPMPAPRNFHAVAVTDDILYAVGGNNGAFLSTVDAYDPVTDTWTAKAPMPTPRLGLGVGVVNGIIYAIGGRYNIGGTDINLGTVEAYDPATNTWTSKAPMPTPRERCGVGVVNGIIYAIGGTNHNNSPFFLTVEAYDPASDSWTTKAPPLLAAAPAADVINGTVYAVGGGASCSTQGTVEAFTPGAPANTPPVALCQNVTVGAGANCTASASIDNGSYDPDSGDTITLSQSPPGPYSPGNTSVTLTVTDNHGASGQCTATVTVIPPQLTAPSPATVWLGLKNSDDVGTKFDLLAELFKNGTPVGSGQLDSVPGGGSGFNNAVLRTINVALYAPVDICQGDTLSFRVSARIASTSGHRAGTARLWFNDPVADSHFDATIGGVTQSYYLGGGSLLSLSPGPGPKNTIDVFVDRAVGGNPFKPFGTWSITF
jgi:N-acetylneuraminic acid mutarotase